MALNGNARRLSIVVGEDDSWHGKPLYTELVHRAYAAGLAGASVFRGIEGYGASNHIHTTRILSLSDDLPVAVVIVDIAEKIDAFVVEIAPLVSEGLITLSDVDVVRYVGRGERHRAGDDDNGDARAGDGNGDARAGDDGNGDARAGDGQNEPDLPADGR